MRRAVWIAIAVGCAASAQRAEPIPPTCVAFDHEADPEPDVDCDGNLECDVGEGFCMELEPARPDAVVRAAIDHVEAAAFGTLVRVRAGTNDGIDVRWSATLLGRDDAALSAMTWVRLDAHCSTGRVMLPLERTRAATGVRLDAPAPGATPNVWR